MLCRLHNSVRRSSKSRKSRSVILAVCDRGRGELTQPPRLPSLLLTTPECSTTLSRSSSSALIPSSTVVPNAEAVAWTSENANPDQESVDPTAGGKVILSLHESVQVEFDRHMDKFRTLLDDIDMQNNNQLNDLQSQYLHDLVHHAQRAYAALETNVSEISHQHVSDPKTSRSGQSTISTYFSSDVLLRCEDILKAWADITQLAFHFDILRGAYRRKSYRSVLNHCVSKQNRQRCIGLLINIPQQAQFLLDRMEHSPGGLMPSLSSYNYVLTCWAYSIAHLRATMAEKVFQRLKKQDALFTSNNARESYRLIIHAWARSNRDPQAARLATKHLMKMVELFRSEDRPDMEPTLQEYHVVLNAWIHAKNKTSPRKAFLILKLMNSLFEEGLTTIRPDVECYRSVLQTASQRPLRSGTGADIVEPIFAAMKQQLLVPDAECFAAAIETYKNGAVLFSRQSSTKLLKQSSLVPNTRIREHSIGRTLDLLEQIKFAHQQQSLRDVLVSTGTMNHVLEALTVSNRRDRTHIAQNLLNQLESRLLMNSSPEANGGMPYPNFESYRLVMEVWKSDKNEDVNVIVRAAKACLNNMQLHCSQLLEQTLVNPSSSQADIHVSIRRERVHQRIASVFNAFVQVCSSRSLSSSGATDDDDDDGLQILREALSAIQELRQLKVELPDGIIMPESTSSTKTTPNSQEGGQGSDVTTMNSRFLSLSPNAESYACLLEACVYLVPEGKVRYRWVNQVFQLACNDGVVDECVLKQLQKAITEEQYSHLVISKSELVEEMKMVPEQWTLNSLSGRVVTEDGRRTIPLSVHGHLTTTLAMREFQMRRLRDHRNRNLLQGGRVKQNATTGSYAAFTQTGPVPVP